jgi:dihydrolipoamide dehydrogenase
VPIEKSSQVVVLGGGPGGYAAAFMAADLGLQTMLINQEENPGGVCLYRGCIPSKALLHAAKVISESAEVAEIGIHFGKPTIELDKLRSWKQSVVKRLTGGLGQMVKQRKVDYLMGTGTLRDSNSLTVQQADGNTSIVKFDHLILATGSRPMVPPIFDIHSPRVMDSTAALELTDIPKKLLVIGGGYIGLELGSVYAALESEVTVVEMTAGLLPGADRDLVKVLQARLEKKLHSILLNTKVMKLEDTGAGVQVTLQHPDGSTTNDVYDRVLVSIGRRPNTEKLGLDSTKVQLDGRGFVKVDGQCRTTDPKIFAIGDISGEPMLAHRATHQGRLAAEVIHGSKAVFEPQGIPAVVFTDPELAWVGLTELQAKDQGLNFEVARFPWAASGRAITIDRPEGLTKLIVDKDTNRILGMGIVGAGAGEMIAEGTLALEMGAQVEDLALTIHPHPTLSETVMEAADVFFGKSTHLFRPKTKA